jgi:predicted HicB family RNase H-like nuclease
MPNINIIIPDEVHKQLRLAAVKKDTTLKELIIKLLEESVK